MNIENHSPTRSETICEITQRAIRGSGSNVLKFASDVVEAYLRAVPPTARIIAKEVGCGKDGLIEIDAASTSGIDDIRALTDKLRYRGFGESPTRAVIIDEAHRLSKPAFDGLLLITEQPPEHVYFFLCSTEPDKIPKAILTRGVNYELRRVRDDDIFELLVSVVRAEDLDTPDRVLDAVTFAADGSPRAALTMLAKVSHCDDRKEAEDLLQWAGENAEVVELCRMLVRNQLTWGRLTKTLTELKETVTAESIRIIVTNYLNAVLMNCSDDEAPRLLDILESFSKPGNQSDKLAPVLIAFGRYIFP